MVTNKKKLGKDLNTEVDRKKRMQLDNFITSMNKKFLKDEDGENIVIRLSDAPVKIPRNSTGIPSLDFILGGGLGKGRITEIYGPESSGKTTVCLHYVAKRQSEGDTVLYIDTENAIVPEYARQLGVNLEELFLSQPRSAESALQLAIEAAGSGLIDTIIIDSVASLATKASISGDVGDAQVGDVARLMAKTLKNLVTLLNRNGVDLVLVNQERVAIGQFSPFGTPLSTTGGKAIKYFASIRISVKSKQIAGKGANPPVGIQMTLKTTKNKTAPPFRSTTVDFIFGEGFDYVSMMWDVANKLGVVFKHSPQARSFFIKDTGEEIFKGSKDEAKEAFLNDKALQDRIAKLCYIEMENNTNPYENQDDESNDSDANNTETVD